MAIIEGLDPRSPSNGTGRTYGANPMDDGRILMPDGTWYDSGDSGFGQTQKSTTIKPKASGPKHDDVALLTSRAANSTLAKPAPVSPTGPSLFTASGGGGGGGGGGAAAPSTAAAPAPPVYETVGTQSATTIATLQDQAAANTAQLDAQYSQAVEELKAQFQLAETPEEKARLAAILEDLDAQRLAGLEAISNGYRTAVSNVQATEEASRASTAVEAQAMGQLYRDAATNVTGSARGVSSGSVAGLGLGVNADGGSRVGDAFAALMAAAAPREQALQQRLGGLTADDLAWLGSTLEGESAAKQGDLQRMVAGLAGQAQIDHAGTVSNRVNAERQQMIGMLGNLQGDYRNRGWSVEDQQLDALAQLADQQARSEEASRNRNLDRELQAERLAVEQEMQNRSIAAQRAASAGSGSKPLTPAQQLAQQLGLLNDGLSAGPAGVNLLLNNGFDPSIFDAPQKSSPGVGATILNAILSGVGALGGK